ncbi:MAG TPA: tetratricopeptide repeat protein [Terriglobales bacterium]
MFSKMLFAVSLSIASLTANASPNTLGTVHFQTSCSPSVTTEFNQAVALLYSFEYDEARDQFVEISRKDPNCAMAKWGEAMTYFHGLWGEYNWAGGAKAAQEARDIASRVPATTAREKAYIAAISEVFSEEARKLSDNDNNKPNAQGYSEPDRQPEVAYKEKMAALHQAFPDDDEGTIFYALSLNIIARRADKQHPELHECTALLNPLFQRMPNHPGIAHYLVHCNDNPEMAKDGLVAARKYAQIAPASAHATHMPSHIFAQLGLWDEMVASNRASLAASEADKRASVCQTVGNSLHAMYFLTFALLQKGEVKEARDVLTHAKGVTSSAPGADRCDDDDGLVIAGYTMESGEWERAKDIKLNISPYGMIPGILWMVKGVGAARTGDLDGARHAEAQLEKMRDSSSSHSHHGGMMMDSGPEAARLVVAGWIAHESGKKEEGETMLRQASDMQDRMGGSNSTFKPYREMLADMLMLDGKNKEALEAYSAVLGHHPNRFNSLYGAGSAAFAMGDSKAGQQYYSDLLKFTQGSERPELELARKKLTQLSASK